jgi:hypothetical protein
MSPSRLVQGRCRIIVLDGAIGMAEDNGHVPKPSGGKLVGEMRDCVARQGEEIVAKREVFNRVSGQGELAREENLGALGIRVFCQFEKTRRVVSPVTHDGVCLGHGQAKTGHTE